MSFAHLVGNEPAKKMLFQMLERGMIGHSFLFAGAAGVGKSAYAKAFAAEIICQDDPHGVHRQKLESGNHPDLHILQPEGKVAQHSIASLRWLGKEVYLPPNEATRKVFIIIDADRMLPTSANALLKTFEEPSADTVIILVSHQPESLLPTVVSRCRRVGFYPVTEQEIVHVLQRDHGLAAEEATPLAHQARGSVGRAVMLNKRGPDPRRKALVEALAHGRLPRYNYLQSLVQQIATELDDQQEHLEAEARKDLLANSKDTMSAAQIGEVEKGIDGLLAANLRNEGREVINIVLEWFRDLHLIRNGISTKYLLNRDLEPQLGVAAQGKGIPPLAAIEKSAKDALLAMERSTPFATCLEGLLLKAGLF